MGIPCLTLRENTERPITVDVGTNVLVGRDLSKLTVELNSILEGRETWHYPSALGRPEPGAYCGCSLL